MPDGDNGQPGADGGPRTAAVHIERGVERYAEGKYDAALKEFESALSAAPGHTRAIECLAWVKEVAGGRRTLQSGTYLAATATGWKDAAGVEPAAALEPAPTGRTIHGLPALEFLSPPPSPAILTPPPDDVGDPVTREWSSSATGRDLPQLDVPELSEEQIANLLEVGGRGLTLNKNPAAATAPPLEPAPQPAAAPEEEEEDGDDERDKTNVRLEGRIVEMVAEAEDPTPLPRHAPAGIIADAPSLEALAAAPLVDPEPDQTNDDPPSAPTNPFHHRKLAELAPSLLAAPEGNVDELPPAPLSSTSGVAPTWAGVRTALERGEGQVAFTVAERLLKEGGPDAASAVEDQGLLQAVYEAVVGDLRGVPRFGKATPDLDSRSAFLLSRMDGSISADDLIDISGMKRLEALRVLAQLVSAGVVTMKP